MIIAGAGGHALEILDVLVNNHKNSLFFFDNINTELPQYLLGYEILKNNSAARDVLRKDKQFIIGTGSPQVRKILYQLFTEMGGEAITCIASTAIISEHKSYIGPGCNIMHGVFISSQVFVGKGTLINTRAHLHHNVDVGDFCEIGPAVLLLGNVKLGNNVFIGAGAILFPGVNVGDGAIIGAGAVVTKNVESGKKVKGSPAK